MQFLIRNKISTVVISLFFVISSCKVAREPNYNYGTFKFTQKPDDVFFTPALKLFLKNNPNCSILLRAPQKAEFVSQEEQFNNKALYFEIEKSLTANNFKVADRNLLERNLFTDSSKKIGVDLIIEMIDIATVTYWTDKIIPAESNSSLIIKAEKEISLGKKIYFNGSKASFKIIMSQSRAIVGTLVLNYTPCMQGCRIKYSSGGLIEEAYSTGHTKRKKGYEYLDEGEDSEIFTQFAKKICEELKKAY